MDAAGLFVHPETSEVHGVARWTGTSWEFIDGVVPDCTGCYIHALLSVDDGEGPALVAVGGFSSIGGVPSTNVARWRNGTWESMGELPGTFCLHLHGDGRDAMLVAGAYGFHTSGIPAYRWTGEVWEQLSGAHAEALTTGSVMAFASHDDGNGLQLYAGTYGAEGIESAVLRWDGFEWLQVGSHLPGNALALCSYDDGTGSALYAGGYLELLDGTTPTPQGVFRWDGKAWSPIGHGVRKLGLTAFLNSVTSLSPGGPNGTLVVGGEFEDVLDAPGFGSVARNIALWGPGGVPHFVGQPSDITVREGEAASFTAVAAASIVGGEQQVSWRRDGLPLTDGDGISGSATPTLRIDAVQFEDAGAYDAIVVNDCGEATSAAARLTVVCFEDIDRSGVVDGSDLGAVLVAWGSSDFNADLTGDGVVDGADIAALVGAWGCTGR
jgi:hypothetical protein